MNIDLKDCISKRSVKVWYAYGKQIDEKETIARIKYYDPSNESVHWISVSDLSKLLLGGDVFVYAG